MPSMHIFRRVQTKPFGSDDLHLVCVLFGIFRVLQLICIAIIWLWLVVRKYRGDASGNRPRYCDEFRDGGRLLVPSRNSTEPSDEVHGGKDGKKWLFSYVTSSFAYVVMDMALLVAIWKAASVGTPTQPFGREKFLRPILRFRIVFMNIFLVGLVVIGILMVYFNREDNYGCNYDDDILKGWYKDALAFDASDSDGKDQVSVFSTLYEETEGTTDFEDTGWYVLFCVILVIQALELLVWPGIITKKTLRWIKSHDGYQRSSTTRRAAFGETLLGGCLHCCGIFCCFRTGGRELGADMRGQLKDSVEAMLDFFNHGGTLNIVLSDLYVSLRMLARVQRERKHDCVGKMLKLMESAKTESGLDLIIPDTVKATTRYVGDIPSEADASIDTFITARDGYEEEDRPVLKDFSRGGSVFALQIEGDEPHYQMKSRSIVSPSEKDDRIVMKEAAHFIKHSSAIYDDLPEFVYEQRWRRICGFPLPLRLVDQSQCSLDEGIELDEIGFNKTSAVYLQPENGIAKTPYSVLIDKEWETVILTIRGTASFEDIVIDLQLTPSKMDGVGKRCGFDGTDQFCHRGVITRCRWLYDDLERHGILDELLLGEKPRCPNHRLVITGHSLGAGCASVLSLMLRQRFPALQCYAFCPPGGLLTKRLAEVCEDFVISVINDTDIIPRMSHDNLERLRDEAFEVLARIKVSKFNMIRVLRRPCNDRYLADQNAKLLFPVDEIPNTTEFYAGLETFKAMKKTQREHGKAVRVPLFPPGKIMYLVKTNHLLALGFRTMKNKYTPQWAEKTDFNEILLAPTVGNDHSVDVVEENLSSLMRSYTGDESVAFSPENENEGEIDDTDRLHGEDFLVLENNFVCCSLPQGTHSLIPALLSTAAIVLTGLSNNWCAFVSRSTWVTTDGLDICKEKLPDHQGLGVSTGLWSYLEKVHDGSGPQDSQASYRDSGQCLAFPQNFTPDAFLLASRICATFCAFVGSVTLTIFWFSACYSFRPKSWYTLTAFSLLASLLQGLVFLYFHSDFCTKSEVTYAGCTVTTQSTCSFDWGAKVGVAASALWFCTAVAAAHCGQAIGRNMPFSLKYARKISRRFKKKTQGIRRSLRHGIRRG
uniref:sn-1-specific diacylglycerol lipase n=1 Tax=Pseudictyota dubia TaxID=2749911 RepID=A0A7R9ZAK0_9STRA|mmetsp:Transcript_3418/g.5989  ORF Transcript_3418/g.5989 Transcript_3418/m.5989 type:complete len:1105 (+) Transcript_3418:186-3500(+)